jgi:hypothetical protein
MSLRIQKKRKEGNKGFIPGASYPGIPTTGAEAYADNVLWALVSTCVVSVTPSSAAACNAGYTGDGRTCQVRYRYRCIHQKGPSTAS